ncbi:uncharacterized protein DUF1631 [Luteimonas cucumeris]|uniref:Uncharacterized protein DUF1631 n=1 Tax=Luteimonas cucumeris TaxID=985012 RepID=A0A562LEY9_9GAMM|nr:DUF1631 domain-containing protein [Luteimonas cucumeris]TWI06182.1 uncharacterized protein DUF1631 [Luteimonas cucumeris]
MVHPKDTQYATLVGSDLPPRVRSALEQLLSVISEEVVRGLGKMLNELEQQLFQQANHARSSTAQDDQFNALRSLRLTRADFIPRYLHGLEDTLARLRTPRIEIEPALVAKPGSQQWQLVDHESSDDEMKLRDLAVRYESRATLTLYLLGQRFGVMAASPAFETERLPVGPRALLRIAHDTAMTLHHDNVLRQLLYRAFEHHVLAGYPPLAELMNDALGKAGILPGLEFVPARIRPAAQAPAATASEPVSRDGTRKPVATAPAADPATTPYTGWLGQADAPSATDDAMQFALLQQLLSGRRGLIGKLQAGSPASSAEALAAPALDEMLGTLQRNPRSAAAPEQKRSLRDVQQAVLAMARQQRGSAATLSREDNDTFDLLGLLYTELEREVRGDTLARELLDRLQVPLLRLALQDRAFFVRSEHPGRMFLNTVAESGATWLGDDGVDPHFENQLAQTVERVVNDYEGDVQVFEQANADLQQQLQVQARRAEVSERRHVEAARGKEKLAVAKQRAATVLDEMIRQQPLPRFVQTLLRQAWADVLTLVLLRNGEQSELWRTHLESTRRIIEVTCAKDSTLDADLATQIEQSMLQVGYHANEAAAMARQLSRAPTESDDAASRTELSVKLKSHTRLGEDATAKKAETRPRNGEEQACYEHLRSLPFGTWMEFTNNQQGDRTRRRLSWYSPITDNALFVNNRGQRIAEMTLDHLARLMAKNQMRVVTVESSRLVDRAWQATLSVLRSFAGQGEQPAWTAPT